MRIAIIGFGAAAIGFIEKIKDSDNEIHVFEKSKDIYSSSISGIRADGKLFVSKEMGGDIDVDIANRDVIIVEDIVDSGLTLKYLDEYFMQHNPNSVKICTLLDKPNAHQIDIKIDYIGFEVGNEFVVGYGLDYAQKYRNLPYIGILKKEIYS